MLIRSTNDRLYDTRNFDSYKNYYAILYNKEKYQLMKNKNHEDSYTVYADYINALLILEVDNKKEESDNIFNIVYGHFYNDQNFFLFKKTKNGKIVGYKINKCKRAELWHNKLNQLYISNYFDDIHKTAFILNNNANKNISDETTCDALSYIVYRKGDETLDFKELYSGNYRYETLEIIINNPYIIKRKI